MELGAKRNLSALILALYDPSARPAEGGPTSPQTSSLGLRGSGRGSRNGRSPDEEIGASLFVPKARLHIPYDVALFLGPLPRSGRCRPIAGYGKPAA